jgi:hypothetical protein
LQSPFTHSAKKVNLSIGIVAIAALFGGMVFSFFSRRTQQPTQPTHEIDLASLNQAIADLTSEIKATKLEIEQIQNAQGQSTPNTKSEEEIEKLHFGKIFNFKYHKPFEVQQLIVSVVGFILIIAGLFYTIKQFDENTTALRLSTTAVNLNAEALNLAANQNIMSHTLDVDKLFIDSPELRPYFFKGVTVTPSNKDYNKAAAVAVYQLDFFDTFFGQSGDWLVLQNEPAAQDAWMQYFNDSFQHSPIMCVQLKQFANEYTPEFVDMFKGDCQKEFST